jgi:hypothetical protein
MRYPQALEVHAGTVVQDDPDLSSNAADEFEDKVSTAATVWALTACGWTESLRRSMWDSKYMSMMHARRVTACGPNGPGIALRG